jgi:hypothetical protein
MSYDLYLVDPVTQETLTLAEPHFMRGGTYAVGGDTHAHLNITYNYAKHFCRVFEELPAPRPLAPRWLHEQDEPVGGIRTLYGLSGAESLPLLDQAIALLGDDVSDNYWEATEGNAKRALMQLRALATMRPDGVWDGD